MHPHPPYMTLRSRSQTKNLYVKVFFDLVISKLCGIFVSVWHDDRCWSKILCSTIPNPVHDFKVKVMDLELFY